MHMLYASYLASPLPVLTSALLHSQVWAHQHNLSQPCDGLSGPLLSWLVVYLAQCGRLVSLPFWNTVTAPTKTQILDIFYTHINLPGSLV